jgi:hypothetical protein
MKIVMLATLAVAVALTVSAPAMAQMGSSTMSNGSMSSDAKPATCQGMMDKANGMSQPMDASKKSMAMKQMDMAKAAMAKGDEKTCMMHMKTAMHDMM